MTSPDAGATTKSYDAAGNILTSTDGAGRTTTYSYDALNRVGGEVYATGGTTVYQYDQGTYGIGRLTSAADASGTTTSWGYNRFGQVNLKTQTFNGVTLTTRWTYDFVTGRLASITYPSGRVVSFSYDANGRVSGATHQPAGGGSAALLSQVAWRPFGPVASWVFGNGASYSRSYDLDGRISSLSLPANDNIALTYDAASRIVGMTETGLPNKTLGYNKVGRLNFYSDGVNAQGYTYDLVGNRLSFSVTGASPLALNYAYDLASNRLLSISGSWSESFGYDAAGNTVSHSSAAASYGFVYNSRNRMKQWTVGAATTQLRINALGERIATIDTATVVSIYDNGGRLLGRYAGDGSLIEEHFYLGDLPAGFFTPTGVYYVAPDHIGAPHEITDAAQQAVWFWDHDPFGNGAPTGSLTYNLRFPGQFYDAQTGLHYNYFRDYDPKLGRYVESDPIGLAGGINTYGYVGGNPLSYSDPRGLDWSSDFQNYLSESYRHLADAPRQFMDDPSSAIQSGLESTPGIAPELAALRGANRLANALRGARSASKAAPERGGNCPPKGDLTSDEQNAIQDVVNRAGRALEVVGSAARGARGPNSDIDFVAPPSSIPYFEGLEGQLPGIDPSHGIIPGVGKPNIGPVIRFEPR